MTDEEKKAHEKLLNKKNTAAVEQTLSELTTKVYDQQARIDLLQTALSTLSERMISLEQTIMLQRARSFGTGPSVVK